MNRRIALQILGCILPSSALARVVLKVDSRIQVIDLNEYPLIKVEFDGAARFIGAKEIWDAICGPVQPTSQAFPHPEQTK